MAVELPTSRTKLDPRNWRRGRPILSGQANADADFGMRGVSRELNHAYAYRVRVYDSWWSRSDAAVYENSTSSPGTFVDALIAGPVRVAPGVVKVEAYFWASNGTWRLQVFDGSSTNSSAGTLVTTPAAITETVTFTASTAFRTGWARLQVDRTSGQTARLYGWEIAEVELAAGDLT